MFGKIFNSKKKCIVCEKEIEEGKGSKKFGVHFCGEGCLSEYEKLIEKTKEEMNLDKCCE